MLDKYILENYKELEPIFISDLPTNHVSKSALTQRMNTLCKRGLIHKCENGIYYIPKKSKLNIEVAPSADTVAKYKYVSNGKEVKGYYSGHTLANQLGLSTQVPVKVEIVSNNASAKYREVTIGKRTFAIRCSTLKIDSSNVYVLQLLDLLKNIDLYIDGDYEEAKPKVYNYIKKHNITKKDIDQYIRYYPMSVFKNYYEMELEDVFTH